MNRKNKYRERLPIAEWPEIERKMAIIARMTSDPPPLKPDLEKLDTQHDTDSVSPFSDKVIQSERNVSIG